MSKLPEKQCQKIGYSKVEAQTKLNSLFVNGKWSHDTKKGRIYPCPMCNKWHLTSKSKSPGGLGTEFKKIGLFHENKWLKLLEKDE